MNKAVQKLMMALAVCGALCGTAMAAPRGNPPPKGKAPTAMKAPAQKALKAQPARNVSKAPIYCGGRHAAPAKHEPRREVAHHNPPPTPRHEAHRPPEPHRPAPKPVPPRHHHHHNNTLHTEDWCSIGASLVGGIVGGMIGAAM